ncbi:energy-coupling factor transporter transmembrane protein EcfT [Fictibacillus nanhaiensis]|uniref:energy-coupling factor transporter transmembrane component T family protein n=1 Tax=Fictibacillus nanhaiensis TaxID=742169 RepID=UPI001C96DF30|nr:energy-coupling factor transporter transmembrane component T [Fictibacillus nanhaiensis]MBY6035829.1 energy-coupling factor transporter transmembrane protein EcfT [Fictibacillus nanhaiensis]
MHTAFHSKENWLHKVNPSFKLICITLLFLFVLTIHNLNFMIMFTIAIALLFILFTGQSLKRILLFLLPFMLIFLSTALSMIFFGKGETTLFKWGLVHVTEESLFRGIHIGFRALSFALMGLTFALTTRPVLLFYSLMQQLKLPPKYAYSFMAAIRLIPIMIEEFQTIRYARKVRGLQSTKGMNNILKLSISIPIPLLSQSIRRAFRIAVAMEAKRFDSSVKRTFYYKMRISPYDFIFLFYFILLIGLAYFIAFNHPLIPVTDVRY